MFSFLILDSYKALPAIQKNLQTKREESNQNEYLNCQFLRWLMWVMSIQWYIFSSRLCPRPVDKCPVPVLLGLSPPPHLFAGFFHVEKIPLLHDRITKSLSGLYLSGHGGTRRPLPCRFCILYFVPNTTCIGGLVCVLHPTSPLPPYSTVFPSWGEIFCNSMYVVFNPRSCHLNT